MYDSGRGSDNIVRTLLALLMQEELIGMPPPPCSWMHMEFYYP